MQANTRPYPSQGPSDDTEHTSSVVYATILHVRPDAIIKSPNNLSLRLSTSLSLLNREFAASAKLGSVAKVYQYNIDNVFT